MYRLVPYRLLAAAGACALSGQAPGGKQYKNAAEYEAYNAVVKDIAASNFSQATTDLDAWKQKYPQTDFEAEREVLYLKVCVSGRRFAKAVDKAGEVLGRGLDQVFKDPRDGPSQEVQLLYNATISVPMIADPTPAEIATGQAVARSLMNLERRPAGLSDADWSKLRSDVQAPAKAALVYLALLPGSRAMMAKPPDCTTAQTVLEKALEDYPDSASIAYNLGRAYLCLKKYSVAIYEFARAEGQDATLGGTQSAAKLRAMVDDDYKTLHGGTDGLEQLREQAKQSPMPPAGLLHASRSAVVKQSGSSAYRSSRSGPRLRGFAPAHIMRLVHFMSAWPAKCRSARSAWACSESASSG